MKMIVLLLFLNWRKIKSNFKTTYENDILTLQNFYKIKHFLLLLSTTILMSLKSNKNIFMKTKFKQSMSVLNKK